VENTNSWPLSNPTTVKKKGDANNLNARGILHSDRNESWAKNASSLVDLIQIGDGSSVYVYPLYFGHRRVVLNVSQRIIILLYWSKTTCVYNILHCAYIIAIIIARMNNWKQKLDRRQKILNERNGRGGGRRESTYSDHKEHTRRAHIIIISVYNKPLGMYTRGGVVIIFHNYYTV